MYKRLELRNSSFDRHERTSTEQNSISTDRFRGTSRFRVVRTSVGIKLGQGPWYFTRGDKLDGVLMEHPVNASRKVIISTSLGTFNVNQEDIEEL